MGLLPEQFWSMTFFELASYSAHARHQDERAWLHTSSLMALHANLNRDSKRKPQPYTAQDFNPYGAKKKKAKFVRVLTEEEKELTASWATKLPGNHGDN